MRPNEELVEDVTQKKQKLTPKPIAPKVWAPSLKDDNEEPILVDAKAFNNHILYSKINQALILAEDYDHAMNMKDARGGWSTLTTMYTNLLDQVPKYFAIYELLILFAFCSGEIP